MLDPDPELGSIDRLEVLPVNPQTSIDYLLGRFAEDAAAQAASKPSRRLRWGVSAYLPKIRLRSKVPSAHREKRSQQQSIACVPG